MEVLRLFSMISHSITCSWEVTLHFVWRVVVKNPKNKNICACARAHTQSRTHIHVELCRILRRRLQRLWRDRIRSHSCGARRERGHSNETLSFIRHMCYARCRNIIHMCVRQMNKILSEQLWILTLGSIYRTENDTARRMYAT